MYNSDNVPFARYRYRYRYIAISTLQQTAGMDYSGVETKVSWVAGEPRWKKIGLYAIYAISSLQQTKVSWVEIFNEDRIFSELHLQGSRDERRSAVPCPPLAWTFTHNLHLRRVVFLRYICSLILRSLLLFLTSPFVLILRIKNLTSKKKLYGACF